jgi:hypothetical protein
VAAEAGEGDGQIRVCPRVARFQLDDLAESGRRLFGPVLVQGERSQGVPGGHVRRIDG